jgi:predicted RNA-binding Zn-ribbon protein involved in translation (DUF1610 family)
MPRVREQARVRWSSRICRGCGYDGAEMQRQGEGSVFECPCCGEDLYARRPMSYAEMEGFCPSPRVTEWPADGTGGAWASTPRPTSTRPWFVRVLAWLRLRP